MVNIEDLKKMGAGRISIADLPSEFFGVLEREEERTDRMGRKCLYWIISTEQGTLTQKYSPMHIDALAEALEKLKVKNTVELIGKTLKFKSKNFRIGNPRWLPVEVKY
jgi:hypothetical protein